VAAPRDADRCPIPRAHQRPIAPPAITAANAMEEATSCVVDPPRDAHRCPTPRAHHRAIVPMRRRRVSWPLRVPPTAALPPAPATSHRADAETPFVVAAPRDAHRCPIPRAHQRPIAPPATTAVDATDEALPCAGFSSAKDTGCY